MIDESSAVETKFYPSSCIILLKNQNSKQNYDFEENSSCMIDKSSGLNLISMYILCEKSFICILIYKTISTKF